jgi:hypothetical protein
LRTLKSISGLTLLFFLFGCSLFSPPIAGAYGKIAADDEEVVKAVNFAINKHENMLDKGTKISLVKVSKAGKQVVAGMNYRMLVKVKVNGREEEAEVVVWRKLSGEYELTSWNWK